MSQTLNIGLQGNEQTSWRLGGEGKRTHGAKEEAKGIQKRIQVAVNESVNEYVNEIKLATCKGTSRQGSRGQGSPDIEGGDKLIEGGDNFESHDWHPLIDTRWLALMIDSLCDWSWQVTRLNFLAVNHLTLCFRIGNVNQKALRRVQQIWGHSRLIRF